MKPQPPAHTWHAHLGDVGEGASHCSGLSGCLCLTSAFLGLREGVPSNHVEPSLHCHSPPPSRAGLALCPCLGPCGEPVGSASGDRVLAVSRGGTPTLQRLRVSLLAKGALPVLRHKPSVGPTEW